jgi:hypothetical protein
MLLVINKLNSLFVIIFLKDDLFSGFLKGICSGEV